jgi:hypothetical protein
MRKSAYGTPLVIRNGSEPVVLDKVDISGSSYDEKFIQARLLVGWSFSRPSFGETRRPGERLSRRFSITRRSFRAGTTRTCSEKRRDGLVGKAMHCMNWSQSNIPMSRKPSS